VAGDRRIPEENVASDPRPHFAAATIGASVTALVTLGLRSLAPFSGAQLDVRLSVLGSALLGFAVGLGVGVRWRGRAGAWTLPWPWVRGPLLRVLEHAGLPAGTLLAAAALVLVPALALGVAFAALALGESRRRQDAGPALLGLVALALVAAWGVAAAAPLLLIPVLGVNRSVLCFALLQVVAAFLLQTRAAAGRLAAGSAGLVLLLGAMAGVALWRAPRCQAAPEFGLRFVEESADCDLRVLDRDEVRYLLVDGTIVDVADPATGLPLARGPAALRMTEQLFPAPGRALVLGMRGGALPMQLARGGWAVTVVEPEPRLVEAACREFGLGRAEVAVAAVEPRSFLRRNGLRFDFIAIDLSGSGALRAPWLTREFCTAVRARLEPQGGMLAVAVEARGWNDVLVRSLAATLRTEFAHVVALPTAEPPDQLGCVVLLAADRPLECPDDALPDVRAALGDSYAHWVAMQQTHAWFNRYEPVAAGARILTDDRNPLETWGMRIDRAARRELHAFFGPYARAW
jgi:hypothetical protein